jgi:hypothetical protein
MVGGDCFFLLQRGGFLRGKMRLSTMLTAYAKREKLWLLHTHNKEKVFLNEDSSYPPEEK